MTYFNSGQQEEMGMMKDVMRRNNGIIDPVEDAVDLITALKEKGYTNEQIKYVELEDGRHYVEIWARTFPDFLKWGWSIEK